MREEMHGQLSSLWLRLQTVEEKMRIEIPAPVNAEQIDVAQDPVLPGSVLNAVVPSAVVEAKSQKGDLPARRTPVFQPHIGQMEEEDEDDEPIPFAETVWNVVLVLGSTGAGRVDLLLTMLLAVGSVMLQFLFVFVLVSEDFLGGGFDAEIAAARTWRASIAHDAKYRDLSGTSLASRVCNGDGSLIQSNEQANLLADINSFLGLQSEDFAVSGLAPGMILSGLCMLLWCMYLCREFRTIWISMEAILHIPRARKTDFSSGRFAAISYFRLAAYLILRLYRTAITGCLLWAGQQWLANTKSITDLILNASALGTILEIDELVFASLLPKKIQAAIYSLEAVKVRYTRAKSQLEATLIFIGVVAVTLAPIFLWVMPLVDNMQQVKSEFCYGAQNFVVAYNQDSQTTVGLATPSFAVRYENGLSLSERAVLGHTVPTAETTFVGPLRAGVHY
ncbi:unnamed protein product [Symbiodinium microadriaticum]|nr:unnamed protein product [Symbiodinium microadriaticum]